MAVHSTFIKAAAIGSHRFSPLLKYGEDGEFVNTIILQKCKLGCVREAKYLHRRRKNKSSALDNEIRSVEYLFNSPEYYHRALFTLSTRLYGKVLLFIQYTIMYEIKWRIQRPITALFTEDIIIGYRKTIIQSLRYIDDRIILMQTGLPLYLKILCISQKLNLDIRYSFRCNDGSLWYSNIEIINKTRLNNYFTLASVHSAGRTITLNYLDTCWLESSQYRLVLKDETNQEFFSIYQEGEKSTRTMFGDFLISRTLCFRMTLPPATTHFSLYPVFQFLHSNCSNCSVRLDISCAARIKNYRMLDRYNLYITKKCLSFHNKASYSFFRPIHMYIVVICLLITSRFLRKSSILYPERRYSHLHRK